MIRRADELLNECAQLIPADTTADSADTVAGGNVAAEAAERLRYDALMNRYHDVIANVSKLVDMTTESIHKRDNLSVSC